jgi:hypothetical protein
MKKLKTGKEEIIYLLTRAIEKYKLDTGQEIIQNTNRKNYETLAITLSDISNQLPLKAEEWKTDTYPTDVSGKEKKYPYRKYDITGGQIKDALIGIVSNPRPFLIDACYVYLYNIGRSGFEKNPLDDNLLEKSAEEIQNNTQQAENENKQLHQQLALLQEEGKKKQRKLKIGFTIAALASVLVIGLAFFALRNYTQWQAIKKDMNLLPYQPTQDEIDSLEGVWLCYTGSPQARISDPARYHKVVPNLVEIQYKNGYFTFNRYGASFDHIGYMQFESPGVVSVYSRIKNNSLVTESPRHSLLNLNTSKTYLAAISASWNFDIGERNKIIGIREIFIKLGKAGSIEEVINEVENASCQCKIIRWHKTDKQVQTFYLKNELLDSLHLNEIKPLINENSILLGVPQDGLIIFKDTMR